MNKDVFRLYQLKQGEAFEDLLFQSARFLREASIIITVDNYDLIHESPMFADEDLSAVRKRLDSYKRQDQFHHSISASDVIVLIRCEQPLCYYVEETGYTILQNFLGTTSTGGLTPETDNYSIEGKNGLWKCIGTMTMDNLMFFLMESKLYGQGSGNLVVDEGGRIVIENVLNGFDAAVTAQIQKFLHPETVQQPPEKQELLHYQKFYENGEYVRSASPEVTEEQNYNMIDGVRNNQQRNKPRVSVRKRLREKQAQLGKLPKQNVMVREKT